MTDILEEINLTLDKKSFFQVLNILHSSNYSIFFESSIKYGPSTREIEYVKKTEHGLLVGVNIISFWGVKGLVSGYIMDNYYNNYLMKLYFDIFIHNFCVLLYELYKKNNSSKNSSVLKRTIHQVVEYTPYNYSIAYLKNLFLKCNIKLKYIMKKMPVPSSSNLIILGDYCFVKQPVFYIEACKQDIISSEDTCLKSFLENKFPNCIVIIRTIYSII